MTLILPLLLFETASLSEQIIFWSAILYTCIMYRQYRVHGLFKHCHLCTYTEPRGINSLKSSRTLNWTPMSFFILQICLVWKHSMICSPSSLTMYAQRVRPNSGYTLSVHTRTRIPLKWNSTTKHNFQVTHLLNGITFLTTVNYYYIERFCFWITEISVNVYKMYLNICNNLWTFWNSNLDSGIFWFQSAHSNH